MSDETITVGSAQVDLGDAFRESAKARIREAAQKYLGNLNMASVHVARDGHAYRCSVTIQMGGLPAMSAEDQAPEVPLAFRGALGKVEKQMRRTKRALREDRPDRPDRSVTA